MREHPARRVRRQARDPIVLVLREHLVERRVRSGDEAHDAARLVEPQVAQHLAQRVVHRAPCEVEVARSPSSAINCSPHSPRFATLAG